MPDDDFLYYIAHAFLGARRSADTTNMPRFDGRVSPPMHGKAQSAAARADGISET